LDDEEVVGAYVAIPESLVCNPDLHPPLPRLYEPPRFLELSPNPYNLIMVHTP